MVKTTENDVKKHVIIIMKNLKIQYKNWIDCTKKYNTCMAPYNECKDNIKKCEEKCNTTNPIKFSPAELAAQAQDRACQKQIKEVKDKYINKKFSDFLFFQQGDWKTKYNNDMKITGCEDSKYDTSKDKLKDTTNTDHITIQSKAGWAGFLSVIIIFVCIVILVGGGIFLSEYIKAKNSPQKGGLKLPTVKYYY